MLTDAELREWRAKLEPHRPDSKYIAELIDEVLAWRAPISEEEVNISAELLSQDRTRLRALLAKAKEALANAKMKDLSSKTYVGFISKSGCWSVEWPTEGSGICREWFAERDAAIAEIEKALAG